MLTDNGEDKDGDPALDVVDTRSPLVVADVIEIAVPKDDQIEDEREEQPGDEETHGEDQQTPAPFDVHQRRENVADKERMIDKNLSTK